VRVRILAGLMLLAVAAGSGCASDAASPTSTVQTVAQAATTTTPAVVTTAAPTATSTAPTTISAASTTITALEGHIEGLPSLEKVTSRGDYLRLEMLVDEYPPVIYGYTWLWAADYVDVNLTVTLAPTTYWEDASRLDEVGFAVCHPGNNDRCPCDRRRSGPEDASNQG
jgi:ABC-type transport system substrate-binding protein